mmetsp:Transcript_17475/g.12493  ORF Transcript_17475/g.12493 Transcript_17475/m.12493 type:complete len:197 (-) Transcript_17475:1214-1804(-)
MTEPFDDDEEVKEGNEESSLNSRKVIFLLPFCIPCCGKTFLWNTLQKKFAPEGWSFVSVSSDDIRQDEMSKYLSKNKNASKDDAFEATRKTGPRAFSDRLRYLTKDVHNHNNGQTHVIFVDKNHPPNGMKNSLNDIFDSMPADTDYRVCYLVPDMTGQDLLNGYPISAEFILTCLHRLQNRTDHGTLTNEDPIKAL